MQTKPNPYHVLANTGGNYAIDYASWEQARIKQKESGGGGRHGGERGARAYNGGSGAVSPVGSRGKVPDWGQGALPPEADEVFSVK
jgi:hypothetical protein